MTRSPEKQPQNANYTPRTSLPPFSFPQDRKLLIVTSNAVSEWDGTSGLQKIYRSIHDGIMAAKRSDDGRLAVADGGVVVLEYSGSPKERYKLKTDDGTLMILAFAQTIRQLLFSTSLQPAVMRYSITEDRVLGWTCPHPSPPSVLAVSVNAKYAVSASSLPSTVYLSPMDAMNHVLVKPNASPAVVTAAAFHPETEEHFLLGYADGTISVHTASRIVLMQSTGSDGGIGHLKRSHHVINERPYRYPIPEHRPYADGKPLRIGPSGPGVTAAAFMNGCKLRAVTVAGDGKCRTIDFERGAQVLRTWSIHAPAISLAVYSPGTDHDEAMNDPVPRHAIAIGTAHGYVNIYDYLGLLHSEQLVDSGHRKVIGLDWVSSSASNSGRRPTLDLDNSTEAETPLTVVRWSFATPGRIHHEDAHLTLSVPQQDEPASIVDEEPITSLIPKTTTSWPKSLCSSSKKAAKTRQKNENSTAALSSPPTPSRLIDSLRRRTGASTTQWRPTLASAYTLAGNAPDGSRLVESSRTTLKVDKSALHELSAAPKTDPSIRTRRDSIMPCTWVSENDLNIHPRQEQLSREARKLSLTSPANGRLPMAREVASISTHRTQRSPKQPARLVSRIDWRKSSSSSSNSKGSLADISAGSEIGVEVSPVREYERHRAQRLRRMTIHDSLHLSHRAKGRAYRHRVAQHVLGQRTELPMEDAILPSLPSSPRKSTSSPASDASPKPADGSLLRNWNLEEPLPKPPVSMQMPCCDCDCADAVREEMALVRGELASLRKALWVFGIRVEAGERWDEGLGSFGLTTSGKVAPAGSMNEEQRERTMRRSSR